VPSYAVTVESVALWVGLFAGAATVVGAAIAVVAIYVQLKATRFSTSIDTLWRLQDEWSSRDMRCARVAVADGLRSNQLSTVEHGQVNDVVNFFEFLGLLVRKGAVDLDGAWNNFSDWALPYWEELSGWIDEHRNGDQTVWENYGRLEKQLIGVEAARRHLSPDAILLKIQDGIPAFLEKESRLSIA
jgi:hypothetical protein